MKQLLVLVVVLWGNHFQPAQLLSQPGRYQRFISAGYTVPIEADRISDGIAHSLTGYFGLVRKRNKIFGITATAGFDIHTLSQNLRQEMAAVGTFGRYFIQNRNIKTYAEGMLGGGLYREVWTEPSPLFPDDGPPDPDNYYFIHLNLGGGVDIPLGDSDWHFGLGGSYAFALHKNGTGAFFVPRVSFSRY